MTLRSAGTSQLATAPPAAAATYRVSFVAHVHALLALGFERLDPAALEVKDEPAITGLLVQQMRAVCVSRSAPKWAYQLAVHDDPPQNTGGREGKHRPRADIEVERVRNRAGPRPHFHFEAKRLYASSGARELLGEDGLGCFLSGRYGAGMADVGLLGYVQSDTLAAWSQRIATCLARDRRRYGLVGHGSVWEQRRTELLDASFTATHRRGPSTIAVHSTLLPCCQSAQGALSKANPQA